MTIARPPAFALLPLCGLAAGLSVAGCGTSKLGERSAAELRRALSESTRRELRDAQSSPLPRLTEREDATSRLDLTPEARQALDALAGPRAYDRARLPLPADLMGQAPRTVDVTLERAVKTAASNNLAIQFARLGTAIGEAQVVQAEAAFDWTFFTGASATRTDSPQIRRGFFGDDFDRRELVNWQAGLRRTLVGGGRFSIQQDLANTDVITPGFNAFPNPANQVGVTLQYDQPLLRGFGSDVALSEVRLARNAERQAVQSLRRDLIRVITETERTYWELARAQRELVVLQRLLERGVQKRDQLQAREAAQLEAASAVKDAIFRVTDRQSQLRRAQTVLKIAGDRLKQLVNDPEIPIGSEVVPLTTDDPLDQPLRFNLAEAMLSAIENRPEIQQAVLAIDDASIRHTVARSSRLPQLDLRLQARFAELTDDVGSAYRDVFAGQFVDTVVAMAFEQPLGNRRGEAELRRRQFERSQAGIAYMNQVQLVVGEVKEALNRVVTNYQLIELTRANRLAAAEVLRSTTVESELMHDFSAVRLDLELNRQERLAQAEREEIAAITEYNTAVAELYQAMGLTLERNRIRLDVPRADDPRDPEPGWRGIPPWRLPDEPVQRTRASRGRTPAPPLPVPVAPGDEPQAPAEPAPARGRKIPVP